MWLPAGAASEKTTSFGQIFMSVSVNNMVFSLFQVSPGFPRAWKDISTNWLLKINPVSHSQALALN
jgi:hypothetical protein